MLDSRKKRKDWRQGFASGWDNQVFPAAMPDRTSASLRNGAEVLRQSREASVPGGCGGSVQTRVKRGHLEASFPAVSGACTRGFANPQARGLS